MKVKVVKEIENLLDELISCEQPTEEIASQILELIRNKDIGEIIAD